MKNVKHANYTQIDNESQIVEKEDIIVLTSPQAYEMFDWTREYFPEKPKEGYFIWAKKSIPVPVITNVVMCSQYVTQDAFNLVVVEDDVNVKMYNTCSAQRGNLFGKHIGRSKIIVKENARIDVSHIHSWGNDDVVDAITDLILEKGAEATFSQKCRNTPKELKLYNRNYLDKNACLNYALTVLAEQGKVDLHDDTYLNGAKANGISRVKMIARDNAELNAESKMIANSAASGHLDCMGLLLGDESNIIAIPELINRDKNASLTHEASIGKISDEVLNYLRSRGLTEDQAIDLVITGFLGEEEKIIIEGNVVSSKINM